MFNGRSMPKSACGSEEGSAIGVKVQGQFGHPRARCRNCLAASDEITGFRYA